MPPSEKPNIAIELHYLPCIDYFAALYEAETIWIDLSEKYPKQTLRNRSYVLTANKIDRLTVPVIKPTGAPYQEIKIDYSQEWRRRHWGSLQSAYGKSAYFHHFGPLLKEIFDAKPPFLFELNLQILTKCLEFLNIRTKITPSFTSGDSLPSGILDLRNHIFDVNEPPKALFHQPEPYYQTFGHDFVPNLSLVDLLFNMGPEASGIVRNSKISY